MIKKNKISKFVSVVLACLVLMSTFTGLLAINGFAVNEAENEVTATSLQLAEDETTEDKAGENVETVEPVNDGVPIEISTEPVTIDDETIDLDNPEADFGKNNYKITFALYNIKSAKEVTMTLVQAEDMEEYKVVFEKETDFLTSTVLPIGKYSVKEIETDDKFVKVSFNIDEFEVKKNDMQNYSITATEKETNFFLKLLANNWLYIVLLAGLFILLHKYQKKKFAE